VSATRAFKVAHLVQLYPPEFRGGTEACVESLAEAQLARGDRVVVIAGSDERDPEGRVDASAYEHVLVCRVRRRPDENFSVDARQPRVAEQVLELLAAEAPDVVHLHHTLNLSGDLGARVAAAGHTVVASLHDYTTLCARHFLVRPDGEACAPHLPVPTARCHACILPDFPAGAEQLTHELAAKQRIARAELDAVALAVVPSRSVERNWLASGLIDAERLHVLPHAVAGLAGPRPPERSRADGRLVIGTWGHLAPAKGVLDLLEALRRANDPRLALLILGEPVDADHAGELLDAAEGLDVNFAGAFRSEELRAVASHIDLAAFPSRAEETFGLVVAEARALGLPVLCSDRGALPESLGAAGEALPARDPSAWATKLVQLANEPARLASWRAAAAADLLDPAAHADAMAALYTRALQRSAAS